MDLDRPHHRTTSSTELFICFTSRLSSSSSSMKISKSILSPGRNRDPPLSLSTSLSRRLRTNGSIKGGQASPMFPSTSKKRGCAFENPEPSSPKVTCIGQVRVKTKKKAAAAKKQTRSLSRRRSGGSGGGGEVSFRKLEDGLGLKGEDKCVAAASFDQGSQRYAHPQPNQHQQECLPHRNQRWVHFPLTICETLRSFGAEFSCLFPCKSWCFSTNEREKEEKGNGARDGHQHSSCGAVFARWLVMLQDGEGGKEREIELVVGEDEKCPSSRARTSSSTRRRHVLEDFEVTSELFEAKSQGGGVGVGCGGGGGGGGGAREGEEKEEARVSICIPPKNALLLMRCRSDPVKMAALTTRFWEAPPVPHDEEDVDEDLENLKQIHVQECKNREDIKPNVGLVDQEKHEMETLVDPIHKEEDDFQTKYQVNDHEKTEKVVEEVHENFVLSTEDEDQEEEEQIAENCLQNKEVEIDNQIDEKGGEGEGEEEEEEEATRAVLLAIESALLEDISAVISVEIDSSIQEQTMTQLPTETGTSCHDEEEEETEPKKPKNEKRLEDEGDKESSVSLLSSSTSVLPDCLLLMMCEPKLSMEVSKETWVCKTDFIRCVPQRHYIDNNNKQVNPLAANAAAMNDVNSTADPNEVSKNQRVSIDSSSDANNDSNNNDDDNNNNTVRLSHPPAPQLRFLSQLAVPRRSSCSLPAAAAVSMATMIEQKLVNAVGYEPFVLTRCKSEPMRKAAKLAAADACYWTKRKLEPLRRAAGVGF